MQVIRTNVILGSIFLIAFSLNLFAQEQNTEKSFTLNWGDFKPYENVEVKASSSSLEWNLNSMLELGDLPPARFLTVDPMADMYPHMTPYHYTLNNPMRYIDPTGMWVASYDSSGNIVNVTAEEGDNLEGLYSQLGITAEQFAEQYGISDMSKYSVVAGQTAFDITSHVVANTNFTSAGNNANCHGFVSTALGLVPDGTQVSDAAIVNNLGSQTTNPNTGNVAVFNNQGQYGFPPEQLRNMNGVPGHSALFIVNNSAGEAQYLNRLNTGRPVTANTQSQIVNYFSNARSQALNMAKQANIPLVMPTLNPTPILYRRK